jgi:DNA polymerase III subunit epsilon
VRGQAKKQRRVQNPPVFWDFPRGKGFQPEFLTMNWLSRILPGSAANTALSEAQRHALKEWESLPDPASSAIHFETRYVVFNTQAAGLKSEDRLLGVAAIALEEGAIRAAQSHYTPMEEGRESEALIALLRFIGKAPLVVFNAGFNGGMLQKVCERHLGMEVRQPVLDLSILLPVFYPEAGLEMARLGEWLAVLDIETFERNHALGDAYAIAKLLQCVLARATAQGQTSVRALMEQERGRRRLMRLPTA